MTESTSSSEQTTMKKPEGLGWRISVSIVTFFGFLTSIILWFFFYAENFNVYQNIAIVVVMLLVFVAIMGATWAPWGMKQSERWDHSPSM
jgi:protein-S-isoprenylcysteine O-methyltransferase Ste14